MLRSQQEVRLFGQRYRAIFAGLAIAATILIILLILNFPQTQGPTSALDALNRFATIGGGRSSSSHSLASPRPQRL